jgi:hypothetical protein
MPIREALTLSAIVGAAACSSGQAVPGTPVPDNAPGFYEFDEPVPWGEVVRLTGVVEVRLDTVLVALDGVPCQGYRGSPRSFYQGCGRIRFTFDRIHPLRRPTASHTREVPFQERVCQEWRQTEQGRRCVRFAFETKFRRETQTVRLRFKPRAAGE